MIALMFVVLAAGSQAQFFRHVDPIAHNFFKKNIPTINTFTNIVENGPRAVVGLTDITGQGNVLTEMTDELKKDVGAVTQPMSSAVLMAISKQCELIKKALGVEYMSDKSLRDLKDLTLQYITPSVRVFYNLDQAAGLIPASRGFDPNLPLIIFAHGFMSIPDSERFSTLVDAFHKMGQYNVLALDSSPYLMWFYMRATTYVRYVGEKLGEVLVDLVQNGVNPRVIHLIGHSLGAHICGFAGKKFTERTGLRVGRISGLDPAGPCFFDVGSDLKLNATDADYVDVIHTGHGSMGITEPCGHSDFYPNGGTQQPNCVLQMCSHELVWKLYAESIVNPQAFVAAKCAGWDQFRANQCEPEKVLMGYSTTPNVRGQFYLQTGPDSPYGLGEAGASYTNSEGRLKKLQRFGPGSPLG